MLTTWKNQTNRLVPLVWILLLVGLWMGCKPSDDKIMTAAQSAVNGVASGINVSVKDGVVTLTGEVENAGVQSSLASALNGLKGIKSVVDNTTIKVVAPPVVINPDDVLKKTLDSVYASKGWKDVSVAVSNGVVTLTGTVKRADLVKVMQAANEVKPGKVENKLTIQ